MKLEANAAGNGRELRRKKLNNHFKFHFWTASKVNICFESILKIYIEADIKIVQN